MGGSHRAFCRRCALVARVEEYVSVFDVTFCECPTLAKRYILQLSSLKAHQREARAGAGRTRTSLRAMSVPHTRATGTYEKTSTCSTIGARVDLSLSRAT